MQHGAEYGVVEDVASGEDVSVVKVYTWSHNALYSGPYMLDANGTLRITNTNYSCQHDMNQQQYYKHMPSSRFKHTQNNNSKHQIKWKRHIMQIPQFIREKNRLKRAFVKKVELWRKWRDVKTVKFNPECMLLNVLGKSGVVGEIEKNFKEWIRWAENVLQEEAEGRQRRRNRNSGSGSEFVITWKSVVPVDGGDESNSKVRMLGLYQLPPIRNVGLIALRVPVQMAEKKASIQGIHFLTALESGEVVDDESFVFTQANASEASQMLLGRKQLIPLDMSQQFTEIWNKIIDSDISTFKCACRIGKILIDGDEKSFLTPDIGSGYFLSHGNLVSKLVSKLPNLIPQSYCQTVALYCNSFEGSSSKFCITLKSEQHPTNPRVRIAPRKTKLFTLNFLDAADRFDFRLTGSCKMIQNGEERSLSPDQLSDLSRIWDECGLDSTPEFSIDDCASGSTLFEKFSLDEIRPVGIFDLFTPFVDNLENVRVKRKLKFKLGSLNVNLAHILDESGQQSSFEISVSSNPMKRFLHSESAFGHAEFASILKQYIFEVISLKKVLESL